MTRKTTALVMTFLASVGARGAAGEVVDAAAAAGAPIRPEALRAHVRFLADDLLEGRGTATRGHEIAARYVAAQLEGMGLEPAGTGGSWFQSVPLRRAELVGERSALALTAGGQARDVVAGRDYVMLPDPLREQSEVTAPVVYVGFGISAPERGHDDYAGADVRGKVVALLLGAPASFPNDERAYYSSRQLKAETAAARGAVGLLVILTPDEEKRFPFARIASMLQAGSMSWLDHQGNPDGVPQSLRGRALLSREGANTLFSGSPRSLDDAFKDAAAGKAVTALILPVEARLRTESRHSTVESPNVLGVLRGSDPILSKEYVVLSAHVDHLGIGPARDGDSVYNGAYDNASGTAGIIEIARAFTSRKNRPRRSILFAAVTAEEKGSLGAEYFTKNPTVPLKDVVVDLNMDMFVTVFPVKDIVAFGGEHSSLGTVVREAAGRLGLTVSPDPFPEQVVFIRSDHYAFVQRGIPSVMLSSGLQSADPKLDGGALFRQWMSTVYHSPRDDFEQTMDFQSAAKIAHLYFLMADQIAATEKRPTWNPGDFFGARFAR
jgi:Zn-dependent M28 family amino/carboxypeptidase